MGEVRVEQTDAGTQVYFKERRLTGAAPEHDADRRARSLKLQPNTIVLLLSPLLGAGLRVLLERLPEHCTVIAVELEPELFALSEEAFARFSDSRLRLCGPTLASIQECISRAAAGPYRRVAELSLSGAAILHRSSYRSIIDALERQIRVSWQNRITVSTLGRLWMRNLFSNLARFARAARLSSLQSNRPIVVCGAGPSLDTEVPLLRALRPRVTIVAADTALPALAAHKIEPDLIVTVDGQYTNVLDFVARRPTGYFLAADLSSAPAAASLHASSRVLLFASEFASTRLFARLLEAGLIDPPLQPLGSVGVVAVSLAQRLGADRILLAGHDLSFSQGRTHAKETYADHYVGASMSRLWSNPITAVSLRHTITVAGKRGMVQTDLRMNGYAELLAAQAQNDHRVADLGSDGVRLGIPQPSVKETLASAQNWRHGPALLLVPQTDRADDTAQFLREERTLLSQLIKALEPMLASGGPAEGRAKTLLEACDYVLFGAPRSGRGVAELRVAYVNARAYSRRIDSALTLLRS